MIQQKRNLPHCKTVVVKNSGIVPSYTTGVDSKTMQQQLTTEPCSVVRQSGIRKQQDDIIHVVPKKTVRERIMKKIQKTKERLAVVSSRHQQQQEGGTSFAGGNSCLDGIVIGEISIPVSCCSNLRSSKNSNKAIEQEEEEKLRIQMVRVYMIRLYSYVKTKNLGTIDRTLFFFRHFGFQQFCIGKMHNIFQKVIVCSMTNERTRLSKFYHINGLLRSNESFV
jgi:hypothetical protein